VTLVGFVLSTVRRYLFPALYHTIARVKKDEKLFAYYQFSSHVVVIVALNVYSLKGFLLLCLNVSSVYSFLILSRIIIISHAS
jgi:hypothetical protein